jgi:hypothetical protein
VRWSKNAVAVLNKNVLETQKEKESLVVSIPLPQALTPSNGGCSSVNKTGIVNALAATVWPSKELRGVVSVRHLNFFCLCINIKRCTRSWTVCFWLELMYTIVTSAWKGIMA